MILIINCNLTLIKNGLMRAYSALQSNNEPASGGEGDDVNFLRRFGRFGGMHPQ